jgi:sigma-E factor negative regulatory protein RseB
VRLLVLLVLTAISVNAALADNKPPLPPKQILERMVTAMAFSNYQGTIVFLKNDKLEAMKYSHDFDKTGEHEKLVSLNSPDREIVRKSDEVSCLFKATKRLVVDHRPYQHSFIVDVPKDLDELEKSYALAIVGEEDIAMTPAFIIAVQPKDEMRYLRKIWVTKAHFLPIQAVIYDLSGDILEQVLFTDFQVKSSSDHGLGKGASVGDAPTSHVKPFLGAYQVNTLPSGFKPVFFDSKPIHQSAQAVDHLILSDGMASVSVYLENKSTEVTIDAAIPEGVHSVGAINSMSRDLGSAQATVLGEVPSSTVKMIVDGIALQNESINKQP